MILYQMLVGRHPFDATEEAPLFRAHLKTRPPSFRARNPEVDLPAELEAVVMRLLDKDPEQRFQRGIDLVEALDAAVGLDVGPLRAISIPPAGRAPSLPVDALPDEPPAAPASVAPPPPPASAPVEGPPPPSSSAPTAPRRVPAGAWIAAATAVVVGLGLGARSMGTSAPGQAAASASASAPASAPEPAAASSPPSGPTPVDPAESAALKARLRAAVKSKDWGPAAAALRELCKVDPASLADPKLLPAAMDTVTSAGQRPGPDADLLFDLLENHAGGAGVDVLYEVIQLKGGTRAAARATEALRRPGVLDKGSAALQIAFKLRDAACEGKAALLPRAVAEGDARVLQIFDSMRSGCGRSRALDQAKKDLIARLSR